MSECTCHKNYNLDTLIPKVGIITRSIFRTRVAPSPKTSRRSFVIRSVSYRLDYKLFRIARALVLLLPDDA